MANENTVNVVLSGEAEQLKKALLEGSGHIENFSKKGQKDIASLSDEMGNTGKAADALAHGLKSALLGSSIAVGFITLKNLVGDVRQELIHTQIAADKVQNGLKFAVGAGNVGAELKFISSSANAMGLELASAGEQYMKLAAASKGTALEGQRARDIFIGVSQASTVMGLSAQGTEGALRAITQMISKGTVQSEELKGQLSEHLPGAFQIASRAMGITTQELGKMLEQGQVISTDFLPKFAAELTKTFGADMDTASQSMQANVNRMANSWTEFKRAFNEAGAADVIKSSVVGTSFALDAVTQNMRIAKEAGHGMFYQLAEGAGTLLGRMMFMKNVDLRLQTNPERVFELSASLKEAEADLKGLHKLLSTAPSDMMLNGRIADTERFIAVTRIALEEQKKLLAQNGVKSDPTKEGIRLSGEGRTAYLERQAVAENTLAVIRQKLSGVNKDYITTLQTLQDLRESNTLGEKDYLRIVTDLAQKNYKAPAAEKASAYDTLRKAIAKTLQTSALELELGTKISAHERTRLDEIGKINEARQKGEITERQRLELIERTNAAAAQAAQAEAAIDQGKFTKDMRDRIAVMQLDIDTQGTLTEGQKLAAKFTRELADGTLKLSDASKIERTALLEELIAWEQKNKQQNEAQKLQQQSLKTHQDAADAANKKAQEIEDEITLYGKNESAIKELTIARLRDEQARQMSYGNTAMVDALEAEIKAIERLAAAKTTHKSMDDSAKQTAAEWKRGWEETDRIARDAFTGWAESGVSMADAIGKALKKALLSAIYEVTLKPIALQIYTSIAGSAPAGALGNASALGNMFSAGSMLGNLGNLGTSGGIIGSIMGSSATYGAAIGTTSIGAGSQAAMLAAQTAEFGAAGAAMTASAGAAGNAFMALVPQIGLAVAGLAVLNAAFGEKSWETKYGGAFDMQSGGSVSKLYGPGTGGEFADQFTQKLMAATDKGINDLFAKIGSTTRLSYLTAGAESSKEGQGFSFAGAKLSTGQSVGQFTSANNRGDKTPEEAAKALIMEMQQVTLQSLQAATDIPKAISDKLDGINIDGLSSDALAKLTGEVSTIITNVTDLQVALGQLPFESVQGLSFDAAAALIEFSGGIDALKNNLNGYYQNYFTVEEQRAQTIVNITKKLTDAGVDLAAFGDMSNAGRGALRAAMEDGANSGAQQQAALLAVQDAYAKITPDIQRATAATQQAASAQNDYARAAEQAAAKIASERTGLQDQLDALTMTSAELLAKQRNALDESNRALFDQIQAQKDLKQAADDAAKAQADYAATMASRTTTQLGIMAQIADVTGNKGMAASVLKQQRDAEIAGLMGKGEAGTAYLTQRLWDYQDAAQKAASASKALADAERIKATNQGWQDKIDITTGARTARQVQQQNDLAAATDDSTRALINQAYAQEDLAALAKTALDAVNAQNAAQQKAADDEAARLKGIASERAGLQDQLDALTMTSAELLTKQRNALDESNRGLFDQVQAAQSAKSAMDALKSTLDNLGATRVNLQQQLLTAQGDTAGALALKRKTELDALTKDKSTTDAAAIAAAYAINTAYEDQITATNEAKKAATEMAQAQKQAADQAQAAAKALSDAWQQATNSVMDEVKRIRGLITGNTPASLAAAQASFAIATAQARAGDQEAYKQLPTLSKALLDVAGAQAKSLLELQTLQGQTAASLEATATGAVTQHGLKLPSFDVGTNVVPHDMIAMIHKGEAIIPAPFNPYIGGVGANGAAQKNDSATKAELLEVIRVLNEKLDSINIATRAVAMHSSNTASLLDEQNKIGVLQRTV